MVRLSEYPRTLQIDLGDHNAAFLWGPRKVGKTTLLRRRFPKAVFYDLLDTELKTRLLLRPALLREEILATHPPLVVVDEVQKVPPLLDEVQWLLENTKTKFVLAGSSARKLRREASNLLGGRAWRYELFPLVSAEVPDFDLGRALNAGLIPQHYLSSKPERSLRSYVLDYLEQEIRSESLTRNLPAFSRFLEAVALTHGQLINYSNLARECGVAPKTAREYFEILEDTLLGHTFPPWRKAKKRRLIETAKFYLFDPGVARALRGMATVQERTEDFGRAFEHFLIEEVRAFVSYREKDLPLSFWRTSNGYEVDLIVGPMELAVECKATRQVREEDARNLIRLAEEHRVRKMLVVSLDPTPRTLAHGVDVVPWRIFCAALWNGEYF